jgi:O-antigen/teichoic acid export membrane protein
MFGLPILNAISAQAPVLILGKVISAHELGLFSLAAIFASMPTDLYTRIVSPVILPAFSEKQDDKRALCRGMLQMTRYTAVLIIPLIAFMACCPRELLAVAYGPQYVTMAIPFAILGVQILARSEAVAFAGLYLAVGQPHLQRRFSVIRAAGIVGLIYPAAVRFGPIGAVVVVALTSFSVLLMQVFQGHKVIDLDLGCYMRCYGAGVVAAVPIIAAVGLLRIFGIDSPLAVLSVGFLAFIVTSAAGVLLFGDRQR